MSNTEIIVIHETLWETIYQAAVTYGGAALLFWFGTYVHSNAMQWFAFIVICVGIVNRAVGMAKRMTIEQARKRLDEIEAGESK